jgi:hypothetical protein
MKFRACIFFLIIFSSCFIKAQDKNVKKNFSVNPSQRVFINGVSSLQFKITGWDKNEADVNVNVKVNTSDAGFGKEYLQNFDITYKTMGNDLIIDVIETSKQGSWSVTDIFKGDFKYSFSKEITGEIFLPKGIILNGDFKYSDITLSNFSEAVTLKGKGNHLTIKECRKVNEITNEYGDLYLGRSSGKLNAELKLSPITMEDFAGSARIHSEGASVNINRFTGALNLYLGNVRGTVEDVTDGVIVYSEVCDITFKKIKGVLQLYDKTSFIRVYDVNGFKLEGTKTDLTAERITAKEKDKVFLTTKNGKYRVSNSSGSYFIDDDYSNYSLSSISGNIYYSASNSRLKGNDLKGDWKSDTNYSEIGLNGISASKIEAVGRGKTFNALILNNPKKVDIKNEDAEVFLTLNKEIKTSVFLTASHGNLFSDFPIHKENDDSVVRAAERINGGGAVISVETKNGNITLKKK